MRRQHGVDGVSQLVSQRGHLARRALIVDQHPGSHLRQDRPAERTSALALADLAVESVLVEDALRQIRNFGVERRKGIQHHVCSRIKFKGFLRARHRGINIVAAQLFHSCMFGFESEIALEDGHILARRIQQGIHGFVGNVVH